MSYNERHNLANGEDNRDGSGNNLSRNCGVEGRDRRPRRAGAARRLQRALLAALLLSQGTPMLLAGDEIGHTQQGNNNAYCQDNDTTWLDWDRADAGAAARYVARLLALRREAALLRSTHWWPADTRPAAHRAAVAAPRGRRRWRPANWERDDRGALMVLFDAPPTEVAWLVLVHAGTDAVDFTLPPGRWTRRLASDGPTARRSRPIGGHGKTCNQDRCGWRTGVRGGDPGATLS